MKSSTGVLSESKRVIERFIPLLNMPKSTKIEVVEDFPQQYNGFDCGLYTLMASDALINNKAWYDPTAERMREKIINIID